MTAGRPTLLPADRLAICRLAIRIYAARFKPRVIAAGLDPEDGQQEAVLGALTRLGSWRPGRAPLDWWVGRAVACAITNWILAQRRPSRCPVGGVGGLDIDVAGTAVAWGTSALEAAWDGLSPREQAKLLEGMSKSDMIWLVDWILGGEPVCLTVEGGGGVKLVRPRARSPKKQRIGGADGGQ